MIWNDWKALAAYGSADAAAEVGLVLNLRHIPYSFESLMMKKNTKNKVYMSICIDAFCIHSIRRTFFKKKTSDNVINFLQLFKGFFWPPGFTGFYGW